MIRILLLEDCEMDADLVKHQLRQGGLQAEVRRVVRLEEFRHALQHDCFDVIISDFSLPGFSGLDALEVYREFGIRIPFILVSGTIGEEMAVECLKAGAHDYVMKGNLKRLVPALERAMRDCQDRATHRAFQRRYEQIVEQANEGIWMMDSEGKITFANRRLAEILDCPLQLLDGYPIASLFSGAEWDKFQLQAHLQPTQVKITCPSLNSLPAPRTVWVTVATSPIHDDFHGTEAILGVMTDMTLAKQLESKLLEARKIEAVGRLAGGLAHDFNNFLSTIIGFTEMAQEELSPEGQAKVYLEEILRAARRGATLTRQLLIIGRRQAPVPDLLGVNFAVEEMAEMLRRLMPAEVRLEIQTRAEPDTVLLDRTAFTQVLMNLVINAKDAMPDGGSLQVVTYNSSPGQVQLKVTDSGTGMTPEVRAAMFEPFFTTKELGKGSGLGLSSVFSIVEQSQGTIEVETEPGRGSTFMISWPLSETALPRPKPPALPDSQERTILVAEDSDEVRQLYVQLLRSQGYKVFEASNATEALSLEQKLRVPLDLLVSDVMMPGLRGPELARLLRDKHPTMRVLLVSGFGSALSPHDDRPDQFLEKPIPPSDLIESVKELLATAAS